MFQGDKEYYWTSEIDLLLLVVLVLVSGTRIPGYSFECYLHLWWRYNNDNEEEYDIDDDGEERGLMVAFT